MEKARRDLRVAEREMKAKTPMTDIACFHAQQSVEKTLKALLTGKGRVPPRTHGLEDLALLLAEDLPEATTWVDQVAELTPYAVSARNPEFADPSRDEGRAAVALARRVYRWARKVLDQLEP